MENRRKSHMLASLWILSVLVILAGCQNIFTYTPLKGLQRDPSTLSSEQKLVYAQEALDSGDKAAMLAAYNAMKTETGNDSLHLSAELGIELSGVPGLLNDAVTDESALTGTPTTIQAYIDSHAAVDPALIVAAGQSMQTLYAADYPLSTNDRLLGAIGLAMGASSPSYDLNNAPDGSLQPAIDLIARLVESGDTFAIKLNDYLVLYN